MSDVGSRTPKQSLLQRKASLPGSDGQPPDERNYEGYYGEDGWWEEDGYHHFGNYDASYYEEWHGEGRPDDIFEVDLYSMVFVLDENLAPKDMYNGFEFEEKSFLFTIEAEDVTPSTPAAWKSRPLKIHPEPPPFRKDMVGTPPPRSGAATDANTGGSNTPTGPGGFTPRQKPAVPPKVDTPKDSGLPPLVATPPSRPVEPPSKEDSDSGDEGKTGKIHINNKQLEHLKQKMQALKQRRASLPEKDKNDDKDGKEKTEDKKEKEKKDKEKVDKEKSDNHKKDEANTNGPKRTESTVHSNCPGAHGLSLFKTPARGWWCSVCEKEHDKGSAFYGCRTCDYDECEACATTARPAKTQVAEKQPEKTPPAPVEASRTTNSNSTPVKAPRAGAAKTSTPPPTKKASSSSSSSSSSSGDSRSKSRSPSRSPPKKKDTKKDKGEGKDSKKKANSKEKNVKKGDTKRDGQDKGDKRKAAKVKVKKTVKRPCKAKSKSRSDDKGSDDKAKKKSKNPRKTKRAASDPKLVPRKPKDAKEAKEESREPKRRKEEKEVSPKKAARSRSRDSDSSSEEPPKKRAANALTVTAEPRAPVSLTRASAARRNEEEKPPADEGARARRNAPAEAEARGRSGRPDGVGGDLLRRVLRANAVHNARQDGGRSKDEPRATLVTRKDESSSEESVARGAATLRPPQDRGVKKAAEAKSRRA